MEFIKNIAVNTRLKEWMFNYRLAATNSISVKHLYIFLLFTFYFLLFICKFIMAMEPMLPGDLIKIEALKDVPINQL